MLSNGRISITAQPNANVQFSRLNKRLITPGPKSSLVAEKCLGFDKQSDLTLVSMRRAKGANLSPPGPDERRMR